MASVVLDHLDPSLSYFSDLGFRFDERYEQPGLWSGGEGALAFELFRRYGGGTEVYVQIATSRSTALRCGETTGHVCDSIRFMDGNRMRVSRSTLVAEGLEVQYRPNGRGDHDHRPEQGNREDAGSGCGRSARTGRGSAAETAGDLTGVVLALVTQPDLSGQLR